MLVKINTKKDFKVFELISPELHANMAVELKNSLWENEAPHRQNVVLDMSQVKCIEAPVIKALEEVQMLYNAGKLSFVVAALPPAVMRSCAGITGFDRLNTVPTLAEAKDMVMMENLERELSDPEA